MTDRPRVLRAPTGLFWLVGVAAVVALLLGDVVVRGSVPQALLIAPWLLIPVWFVYVFLYAPHIAVTDDDVRVHNILRTVRLPWSTVEDVRMRWQLEFELTEAGRAHGDLGAAARRKGVVEAWAITARPGRRPSTRTARASSEADTLEVLRGLRASVGTQPGARITRSWNLVALGSAVAIAAWCVSAWLAAG